MWLWIGVSLVGAFVGLVLLMAIVGVFLQERHVVSLTATYAQPAAKLWEAITDVERFPTWRELDKVERLPDTNGHPTHREYSRMGALTLERVEAVADERLVARIADKELPFGGGWTYELHNTGGGTRLTITETGVVRNPLFRFMSRFVFGHQKSLDDFLRALGRKFGETVQPAVTTEARPAAWEQVL